MDNKLIQSIAPVHIGTASALGFLPIENPKNEAILWIANTDTGGTNPEIAEYICQLINGAAK